MARRSGLGRGLGALIPTDISGEGGSALREVPVGAIAPNPQQPRRYFDEEALGSLTASVAELGVLQPILVRELPNEQYELIAGERRWRAAKRAGLPTVPVVVRDADQVHSLEQALVENLHREDLNALEEAAAYQQLMEDFGLTQEAVAQRVGKSRSAVANTLRLFQLPPAIQRLVAENQLAAGHAKALLGTPDRAFQEALAKQIVEQGLSVREAEEAVRLHGSADADADAAGTDAEAAPGGAPDAGAGTEQGAGRRLRPPGLLELEELLADALSTRVQVTMAAGNGRGKIQVEFSGLEDLERIYRVMTEGSTNLET
ncbi:MAG: ParB/RepB/Spo0J family partition protein [Actinomycetota bacterium]|nr:ParB/RepB/Spo0J family partition protein [Actinomycetota bacterium]